jgi:putative membrane protein
MSEKSKYPTLFLKGLAMGMADVVPGVSGGTIAFITGIYEELIASIGKIDAKALRVLTKQGPMAFFQHINGPFLLALGLGIAISIVSLSRLITYLLDTYPVQVWSFFFGLILASAVYIGSKVKWSHFKEYLALIIGAIVAYLISIASPSGGEVGLVYVFFSASIAICAMILPGISGSFILLLLGSYATVFGAIGHFADEPTVYAPVIATFLAGALIGLLSFAKLLNYLFSNFKTLTIAVLTGFMLGSLAKVWPWKETLSTRLNSKGKEVPLDQANISPSEYAEISGVSVDLMIPILLALLGIVMVYLLSRVDSKKEPHT